MVVVFSLLLTLFVGLLFWPFVLNNILVPTAHVVWVLLRIFVLSVDQAYYWVAIILLTAFFLYSRLLPQPQPTISTENFQNSNETMRTIGYWQSLFTATDQNIQAEKALKKEMARLLISLYAPKQRDLVYYQLYDALRQGELPLPDQIHAFLFLEEPREAGLLQRLRHTPRQWLRDWTGQAAAEHDQMIDDVLGFIETSLEMKNDEGKFNPN